MKKIVYVNQVNENDYRILSEKEFTQKEFEDFLKDDENVYIYNTIEDFASAFNNGYISDLGYMCVVTIKN